MIKRCIAALAAVAVLAFALPAHATNPQAPNSIDANSLAPTQPMQNLAWTGCIPFRVEASTVPVLVFSGSGVLYELNTSSGTSAQAYTIADDSNTLTCSGGAALTAACVTASLGVNAVTNIPAGYAITPRVFTDSGNGAAPTANLGKFAPPQGRRFAKGLVVANSDAGEDVNGCYRTDAMNAANPVTQ